MIEYSRCKELLTSGLSLIAIGEDKVPFHKWKEYQTTTIKEPNFKFLYNSAQCRGVGIVTGYKGLEVVDVDLKIFETPEKQDEFWNSLLSLIHDNIDSFDTKFSIYKTRNNGYHILYKAGTIAGNTKLAKIENKPEAVIETRGIGGYVFVYDNHISGPKYTDIKEVPQDDRDCLIAICKLFNHNAEVPITVPESIAKQVEYQEDIKPWDDYNRRESALDLISDEFTILPKSLPDRYLILRHGSNSQHSGYIYKNSGCMYLFSTGTIYPAEKLLPPFFIYAYKHHHGDLKRAASEIYKNGYGTRHVPKVSKTKAVQLNEPINEPIAKEINFPIDVLPKNIQEFILEASKSGNMHVDFMGCSFFWAISACIGNTVKFKVSATWTCSPIFWFFLIGDAGIGKSPSLDIMIEPLHEINREQIHRYKTEIAEFKKYEKLEKKDKKDTKNNPEITEPKRSQFIVQDYTQEGLMQAHEDNKNALCVYADEIAGWFKNMNKYNQNGSNIEFWLSSWGNNGPDQLRKQVVANNLPKPFISVIGGIQPGILQTEMGDDKKQNGFTDRVLMCYPKVKKSKSSRRDMDQDIIRDYNLYLKKFFYKFNKMIELDIKGEVIPLITNQTEETSSIFFDYDDKITELLDSDSIPQHIKSIYPKMTSYAARFALALNCLYCFNEGSDISMYKTMRNDSIINGIRLAEYFTYMANKVVLQCKETKDLREIIKGDKRKVDEFSAFKILYDKNPNLNKSRVAAELNISKTIIFKWINAIKDAEN